MWTNISNEGSGLSWVIKSTTKGTSVWVTDGSYMKEIASTISGDGWILLCLQSGFRLCTSFAECTSSAGSYRGELIGRLAIHTMCAAIEDYYPLTAAPVVICCDNQGDIFKSNQTRRRIPMSASQADIKRSLRNVKAKKGDVIQLRVGGSPHGPPQTMEQTEHKSTT